MTADKNISEITIGMPVFNDAHFVEAAIKSLLAQTHSNFKLVISDDCSTDGSAAICQKYAEQDARINYIRQTQNLGISKNMQFLLQQAKTEFFMWAADDDLWSPAFIEKLISALKREKEAVVAFCAFSDIDAKSNLLATFDGYNYSGKNALVRLKKLFTNTSDALGYGVFRRAKMEGVKFPIWGWPNKKCAYNNIYPTICFYLTKGNYCHVEGESLFFNRMKTPQLINHQFPFEEGTVRGLFAFYLRKLNVVTASFNMICRAGNFFLAISLLPYLYWFWKLKPSYYQTKHVVKILLTTKKMALTNKLIFVTSVEPWGEVWFCKHHYAYELSRNNVVYFLNGQKKWSTKNLFSTKLNVNFVKENLYTVDYENNFPIVFFKSFFLLLNDFINSWKLNAIVKKNNDKEIIFWQFDPYRFVTVYLKKPFKRIFHVADSYVTLYTDLQIAKRSDLVICISPDFKARYEVLNKNVIFIPHGVSKDELEIDEGKTNAVKEKYGNFILNIATIYYRIDFDLLHRITEEFTDVNLLCIGPVKKLNDEQAKKWKALFDKKNFFHLERINGKELKNYVAASKICINAEKYNMKEKHLFRSSLKFYNYLAQSKPIVSCLLHDLEFLNNKVAYMTNNSDEYIRYLKLLNSNKLPFDSATAKQFINDAQYSLLIEKIDEHLHAKK